LSANNPLIKGLYQANNFYQGYKKFNIFTSVATLQQAYSGTKKHEITPSADLKSHDDSLPPCSLYKYYNQKALKFANYF
jgi:hypothetical protein